MKLTKEQLKALRKAYPYGTRVELISMGEILLQFSLVQEVECIMLMILEQYILIGITEGK